jgi:sialic acid synthase
MLRLFTPDRLKVASRDVTNLPLLEVMAETKIPIILSTGMTGKKELDDALEIITKYHSNISILHCLSQYPSEYQNINLLTIKYLKEQFSQYTIGYSDHSIGILMPAVAVGMGAEIIEKHITLDRNMKGTDHRGSLEPEGIWRMVRDIRNTEYAIGNYGIFISDKVEATRIKLERSIASLRTIAAGEIIAESDLHLLSPGDGYKWVEKDKIVGKTALVAIPANEIIYSEMLTK